MFFAPLQPEFLHSSGFLHGGHVMIHMTSVKRVFEPFKHTFLAVRLMFSVHEDACDKTRQMFVPLTSVACL